MKKIKALMPEAYDFNGKLPLKQAIPLGLQLVMAMFVGNLTPVSYTHLSNLFDADNEKGANETVEVEIKGLFDGHNSGGVSAAQELYENTLITDVHTAAKVYGNTRCV